MTQPSAVFLQQQMEEHEHVANHARHIRLLIMISNLCLTTALQLGIIFIGLERKTLLLSSWLIILGIYGVIAGKNLYDREIRHRRRVHELYDTLNNLYPNASPKKFFKQKDREHEHQRTYSRSILFSPNILWIAIPVLIALLGLGESLLALFR